MSEQKKVVHIKIEPNTTYVIDVPPEIQEAIAIQTKAQLMAFLLDNANGDAIQMSEKLVKPWALIHNAGSGFDYPQLTNPIELPFEGVGFAESIMNFYSHVSHNAIREFVAGWETRNTRKVGIKSSRKISGQPGWVYVIKADERYKIGISVSDVNKRIESLRTASAFPIEVICIIEVENAREIEALLHNRFRHKRLKGEWFSLDADDLDSLRRMTE